MQHMYPYTENKTLKTGILWQLMQHMAPFTQAYTPPTPSCYITQRQITQRRCMRSLYKR